MWCEHCQTDVATQISDDAESLLCNSCGHVVRQIFAPSLHPETKTAREILERWAEEQQSRRAASAPSRGPGAPENSAEADDSLAAHADNEIPDDAVPSFPPPASKPKWRVDAEHSAPAGPRKPRHNAGRKSRPLEPVSAADIPPEPDEFPLRETAETSASDEAPPSASAVHIRLDAGHAVVPEPHFDARTVRSKAAAQPGRSEAAWGQVLAYAGVGLLSVGTMLVLWGYFGDIARYASTGWLMATAGQMLLLLGIVTLVSGGMQQTTHEVSERIEHLGGRIIRIEESTDKILKAPYFSRSRRRRDSQRTEAEEQDAA